MTAAALCMAILAGVVFGTAERALLVGLLSFVALLLKETVQAYFRHTAQWSWTKSKYIG